MYDYYSHTYLFTPEKRAVSLWANGNVSDLLGKGGGVRCSYLYEYFNPISHLRQQRRTAVFLEISSLLREISSFSGATL